MAEVFPRMQQGLLQDVISVMPVRDLSPDHRHDGLSVPGDYFAKRVLIAPDGPFHQDVVLYGFHFALTVEGAHEPVQVQSAIPKLPVKAPERGHFELACGS